MARYRMAVGAAMLIVGTYLILVTFVMVRSSYDTWVAFFLAPGLFLLFAPVLRRSLAKHEPDQWVRKAVVAGLGVKLAFGFIRFYANSLVLGHGDAKNYFLAGAEVSAEFRSFIFGGPAFQRWITDYTSTRFIRLVASLLYVVTGPTQLGGYVMFSFMSFWGQYLFYRAYCIALPDGLRRRYVFLVFFLPSVVFWPSSIGKEAWMITMLGLGSFGLARLLARERGGYTAMLLGLAALGIVRPHVAALFFAGAAAGFTMRRTGPGGGTTKKILGVLVLAVVAGILLSQLQSFFGQQDGLDTQQALGEATRRSAQGGSQFASAQPTSLAGLPWAVVTVLFRPFLFEAGNLASLVTAFEGTILLALFLWNVPRLLRLPSLLVTRPYVGFALVYTLIFTFAFSAISNFGILARQRTQLFPIAVVLLTVPVQSSLRTRRALDADETGASGAPLPDHPPDVRDGPLPYLSVGTQNRNEPVEAQRP